MQPRNPINSYLVAIFCHHLRATEEIRHSGRSRAAFINHNDSGDDDDNGDSVEE